MTKNIVRFGMKSGNVVKIACDEVSIRHEGGRIISYNLTGTSMGQWFIALDQIEWVNID